MTYIELNAEQFRLEVEAKSDVCLIDVREEYEFEELNAGGKNIPMADVLSNLDIFKGKDQIYIICNSGKRSKAIAYHLSKELTGCSIYSCIGGVKSYFAK